MLAYELADLLCQPDLAVQTKLQLFLKKLYATLQSTVHFSKPAALHKAREQMWILYTTIRATILPPLWRKFLIVKCIQHRAIVDRISK